MVSIMASGEAARSRCGTGDPPSTPIRAHARAMRHLNVLWGVANIYAYFRRKAKPVQRHLQRRGMWLAARRVLAAHFCAEHRRNIVLAKLTPDARAASARYQRQSEAALQHAQHAERAGLQLRPMLLYNPASTGGRPPPISRAAAARRGTRGASSENNAA